MAKRSIIKIDEEKCNGCGACVPACVEGALQIIDGKARLVKETYCDGLGACLGDCPTGALTIEEREADAFDETAVADNLQGQQAKSREKAQAAACSGGCPGAALRQFAAGGSVSAKESGNSVGAKSAPSRLGQWPVQIHLLPLQGDIWRDADVLIAADCVPFAMADFHEGLLAGKTVAIGCPKLDNVSAYIEKLTTIFASNSIRSVTVAHMEVPCCTGLVYATEQAIERAGRKDIALHDVRVGINGTILAET